MRESIVTKTATSLALALTLIPSCLEAQATSVSVHDSHIQGLGERTLTEESSEVAEFEIAIAPENETIPNESTKEEKISKAIVTEEQSTTFVSDSFMIGVIVMGIFGLIVSYRFRKSHDWKRQKRACALFYAMLDNFVDKLNRVPSTGIIFIFLY